MSTQVNNELRRPLHDRKYLTANKLPETNFDGKNREPRRAQTHFPKNAFLLRTGRYADPDGRHSGGCLST